MDEEIDIKIVVEQLRTAGIDSSKQVPALVKLGEWYSKKAKATANASDFTKADALYNAALVRSRLVNHEIDERQILQRIVEIYCEFLYTFANEQEVIVDEIQVEIDSHKAFLANERRILKERHNEIDSCFNTNDKTENQYQVCPYKRVNFVYIKVRSHGATSRRDMLQGHVAGSNFIVCHRSKPCRGDKKLSQRHAA